VTTATGPLVSRWLPFAVPECDVRLYCLPHAGGSASTYRVWAGRLGRVGVCPVQLPGRETRLRETPHTRMETVVGELADVVLADAAGPYAVYGHSLGALVGFELLRELARRGAPPPVHLVVSGSPAPHADSPDDDPSTVGMTDDQAVALLRRLGGTPEWALTDPTVLRMVLPPFRADFTIKETYAYRPGPPLNVPITALAGTSDPRATPTEMKAWRDQTLGRFRLHTLEGGHFAVLEHPDRTAAHLREALHPWSSAAGSPALPR
jgi:surfactin synthase thioesterase subunit